MAKKANDAQIFNSMRRRVLRRRIPRAELIVAAIFLPLLLLIAIWIRLQKENFDPADRDITIEALRQGSIAGELYREPLQRWGERKGVADPQTGVFPAELLAGEWAIDGRVESYDPESVYQKINGAAELYLRFGFQQLHYVTLAKEDLFLTLEDYDQGSFAGALGVFAAQRDPGREVERHGQIHLYPTPVGFVGFRGNHYFKITGSEPGEQIAAKARQLLAVVEKLPLASGGSALGFDRLTGGLGIAFDQVSYEAENVFSIDSLHNFWFGQPESGSPARVFIYQAENAAGAEVVFENLRAEQAYEYTLRESEDGVLLEHNYVPAWFVIRRRGETIYGVDRAPDRNSALRLADRLGEVLDE